MAKKTKVVVKAIVAAHQDFDNETALLEVLKQAQDVLKVQITELVMGYSSSLDKILLKVARDKALNISHIKTDWNDIDVDDCDLRERYDKWKKTTVQYNGRAWAIRNQKMVDEADILICIDAGSTKHIKDLAEEKGIPVHIYKMNAMNEDSFYIKF